MLSNIATHAQVLHVVALLVIPKYLKSPQQPPFCRFSNRMCYLYIMEVCTVIESMRNFLGQMLYEKRQLQCGYMCYYVNMYVGMCVLMCGYMDVCYDVNMYVDMWICVL